MIETLSDESRKVFPGFKEKYFKFVSKDGKAENLELALNEEFDKDLKDAIGQEYRASVSYGCPAYYARVDGNKRLTHAMYDWIKRLVFAKTSMA